MIYENHNMLLRANGIFHVSEDAGIKKFMPRPSPSYYPQINGDVVFGIKGGLLHNYLLPRNCPRVTWYEGPGTTDEDKLRFMNASTAKHVIAVENDWYRQIKTTILYSYEFPPDNFELLDTCAGYYVSYQNTQPINMITIDDTLSELLTRNIELRFLPSLTKLAENISRSSLNFSLIRMRNAR
jgi:hypothetical protein